MKIRLAKKIMKQKNYLCLPYDSISDYWYAKVINFEDKEMFHVIGKYDHRIIKAISLTNHWNARRYINELIKSNKKHPFKLRDVQRNAERLKQYSV